MREIADWFVFLLLGLCGWSDWRKRTMPLLLLIVMSVAIVVLVLAYRTDALWDCAGGGFIGILFFMISKCTKEAIGYGDSWLILLLGIYLGAFVLLQVLFAASSAAGICSLFYLWKHRWKRSETIPFVPFLTFAYIGVILI